MAMGPAPDQYHGDFYGFLLAMEDYDRRFLKSHDLEEGNLYKLKSGLTEGPNGRPRPPERRRIHPPSVASEGLDHGGIS